MSKPAPVNVHGGIMGVLRGSITKAMNEHARLTQQMEHDLNPSADTRPPIQRVVQGPQKRRKPLPTMGGGRPDYDSNTGN